YSSIGGRPQDCGVSLTNKIDNKATARAARPGKYNLASQSRNNSTPKIVKGPTKNPPTLCAKFQIDIVVPLSFIENQCTTTRPHAGQPIPCTHPLIKSKANIIPTEDVATGENPIKIIVNEDRISPAAKK